LKKIEEAIKCMSSSEVALDVSGLVTIGGAVSSILETLPQYGQYGMHPSSVSATCRRFARACTTMLSIQRGMNPYWADILTTAEASDRGFTIQRHTTDDLGLGGRKWCPTCEVNLLPTLRTVGDILSQGPTTDFEELNDREDALNRLKEAVEEANSSHDQADQDSYQRVVALLTLLGLEVGSQ
jgi:hypothetical protein